MLESLECLVAQNLLQLSPGERSIAVVDSETLGSASRLTHLRLDLLTGTVYAVEVGSVSVATYHAVERNVVEATCAFTHFIVHFRSF